MSLTGHDPPQPRTLEEVTEPVVVFLDGQRFALKGRPAQLIAFIVQHAPLAGAADYSTWVFELAAGEAKAKASVQLRWASLEGTRTEPGPPP